jgi:glycosyltransferase involved in cell wall biosynthesis
LPSRHPSPLERGLWGVFRTGFYSAMTISHTSATFSIVVPVYNSADYLHRCLDSIVSQTYKNIEIILINDGSTDGSASICEQYKSIDKRITIIHQDNQGIGLARNQGIKQAIGQYIVFVDNDDMLTENACTSLHQIISKFPEAEIVALSHYDIYKDKTIIRKYKNTPSPTSYISGQDFIKMQIKNATWHKPPWKNVYKKCFLLENNLFFQKTLMEDEEWIPRVFLHAQRVKISDTVHYQRFLRKGSVSRPISIEHKRKRAIAFIHLLYEQEQLYASISDIELRSLLYDWMVETFLWAVVKNGLHKAEYHHILKKEFLDKKSSKIINMVDSFIFGISPNLYYRYYKLRLRILLNLPFFIRYAYRNRHIIFAYSISA